MPLPPPGCWACGAVPSREDIRLGSVLHPREEADGGPWTRIDCPACGAEGVLEEVPGGDPVLAPPEAAGPDMSVVAALFEGRRGREERRKARAWMTRHAGALEALRAARRRASGPRTPPPAPPPPRGGTGRDRAAGAGGPRPAPPPPSPGTALPCTVEEARAVLGVDARAGRKEIDAAFRKASRKCHPDLVAHLDEDFQRLAHGKFLRIRRAHEILTR